MTLLNENFGNLAESYLFSTIASKVAAFKASNPESRLIRLGIGDVTRPLPPVCIEALHKAADDMACSERFHGYGPEQGYAFLREAIVEHDYRSRGVEISADEVFVSDGAKSDCGNIGDIFSPDAIVGVCNPVYPVYVDSNKMAGRGISMIAAGADKGFAAVPDENLKADIIYLCYPNNPTGTVLTRSQMQQWVDFAKSKGSIIIYDSAYEAYIRDENIPHSIYEIPGAETVAIEIRSYSKTAGFTGLRCGYTVVPKALQLKDSTGRTFSLNKLWNRRQCTKFNGASYLSQRAAEAIYSPEGRAQIRSTVDYYMDNAAYMRKCLLDLGYVLYGGENAPYIWIKTPGDMGSWEFFDLLLNKINVVTTPGVGFGSEGEGYIRITAFGSREDCVEAMERFKQL